MQNLAISGALNLKIKKEPFDNDPSKSYSYLHVPIFSTY